MNKDKENKFKRLAKGEYLDLATMESEPYYYKAKPEQQEDGEYISLEARDKTHAYKVSTTENREKFKIRHIPISFKKEKYTEIFSLKYMLERAGIPFEFIDRSSQWSDKREDWQIAYGEINHEGFPTCSVIQNFSSIGNKENLLEIYGLLTDEERKDGTATGYLTAQDVFERIKKHWEGANKKC